MTDQTTALQCIPCFVHCPACDLAVEVHTYGYRAICPECRTLFDLVAVPMEDGGSGGGDNDKEIKGESPPPEDGAGEKTRAQKTRPRPPQDKGALKSSGAQNAPERAQDDGPSSTFVPQLFSEGGSA
jgi:hypothetical protein